MAFQIWNRRYTGSKYKLADWISNLISENCAGNSFCDIFAGTGVMSKQMLDLVDEIYINDFLFSNEVIYKAFFLQEEFQQVFFPVQEEKNRSPLLFQAFRKGSYHLQWI